MSAYDSEETREAFSWCALHSRAATGAEEKFMAKLAEDDAKVSVHLAPRLTFPRVHTALVV